MNPEMPFHGNDQVSKVFRPSMNHSAEIVEKMRTLSCMEAPFSGIQNMLLDGFHYTWREIDNLGLYGKSVYDDARDCGGHIMRTKV